MCNREYLDEKEALNVEVKLAKTKKQTFVLQASITIFSMQWLFRSTFS